MKKKKNINVFSPTEKNIYYLNYSKKQDNVVNVEDGAISVLEIFVGTRIV